jgi:hypothetical protein
MTRPISGGGRIHPTVILKTMQQIDTCCREPVILTASCPNSKHGAGYLTWADLSFY